MSKTQKNEPVRVAEIMGKWLGGGVEAVVLNYYKFIDKHKVQFDFICDSDSTDIPYEEIESLGGKVILIPPYQKIFAYQKELKRVLKEGNYQIVHSHINTLSVFPLRAAKKVGVPIRIAHSHSTSNKKEWKKNLIKNILRPFSKVYATHYFACTEHAGRWLFGNKAFDEGKVLVVNNGIDIDKYVFNEKTRKEKRKEIGLKDTNIVIGHIGRFMTQKNHEFLIDIFEKLYKHNKEYRLILVGQGPLQDAIEEKVNKLGLSKVVYFLGQKTDANKYYQAMDLFLFPSLYEGLGMVVVEAQVSGLPCVVSTEVPQIAKVSEKIKFIDLNSSIDEWTNAVEKITSKDRSISLEKVRECGFDIKEEAKKLENKYLEIMGDNNFEG